MKVAEARRHMRHIIDLCNQLEDFMKKHEDLEDETGFLCDVVGYLCDYKRTLQNAIDEAEINV